MIAAQTENNQDMQDALNFQKFVLNFRNESNWDKYKDQLRGFLNCFYEKPGCKRHFAQLDASFTRFPPEIIHGIVEQSDDPGELEALVFLCGAWGNTARNQKDKLNEVFRFSETVIDSEKVCQNEEPQRWFQGRWTKIVRNAPELHGRLHLEELCSFSSPLFSRLQPVFHDLTLWFHRTTTPYSADMTAALRTFLLKQLKSSTLRKLDVMICADLDLDQELMDFGLSDRCQYLDWDCHPLSPDFFTQIHDAWKQKRFAPDCETRQIQGFFDRSALKALIETLQLKARSKHDQFERTDDSLAAEDLTLSISVCYRNSRASVCIMLQQKEQKKSPNRRGTKRPRTEEDDGLPVEFTDCTYSAGYWESTMCDGNCKLLNLTTNEYRRFWSKEDCEDCVGCTFCAEKNRMPRALARLY